MIALPGAIAAVPCAQSSKPVDNCRSQVRAGAALGATSLIPACRPLRVDLTRPRNRVALVEGIAYVHCRKEVLNFLYTRCGHVEQKVVA